jgi:hypothetical protein
MCRNIRTLYNFEPPATDDDIRAAAVQFVRKLTGFTKPSADNAPVFECAIDEIAAVTKRLLDSMETSSAPRDRAVWEARARTRAAERFAVKA